MNMRNYTLAMRLFIHFLEINKELIFLVARGNL